MTMSSTTSRVGPFEGNGATTSFPFTFKVFNEEDLQVVFTGTDGTETTLTLNSDYEVTLNVDQDSSPGGAVLYPISGSELASGEYLVILRVIDYSQTLDLPATGGAFNPDNLENALDRIVMQVQQLHEITNRSFTLPNGADYGSGGIDTSLPTPVANGYLRWNATGTRLTYSLTVEVDGAATVTPFVRDYVFPSTDADDVVANIGAANASRLAVNVIDEGADPTGVSDSLSAFTTAIATGRAIYVPAGTYTLSGSLDLQNKMIFGDGAKLSIIEADYPDTDVPLVTAGATCVIENLQLRYTSGRVTGSETEGQRVLLRTWGGAGPYALQRGSAVRNVQFGECGTAISDGASATYKPFSITFENLEINGFSFRGVDFQTAGRTGNVWDNIYIISASYTPVDGFYYAGEEASVNIRQLNVENTVFSGNPVYFSKQRAAHIGALHFEGIDITTSGTAYWKLDESAVVCDSFNVLNTRMSATNGYIVECGTAVYISGASNAPDPVNSSWLHIGVYHPKGISRPDAAKYPSYTKIGLDAVLAAGDFYHFYRADVTSDFFYVDVRHYNWDSYGQTGHTGPPSNEDGYDIITYSDPHGRIRFQDLGVKTENANYFDLNAAGVDKIFQCYNELTSEGVQFKMRPYSFEPNSSALSTTEVTLGTATNSWTNAFLSKALILADGITAPSADAGWAKIFVDTADGDLKVIFGDGTTKTIVTDS